MSLDGSRSIATTLLVVQVINEDPTLAIAQVERANDIRHEPAEDTPRKLFAALQLTNKFLRRAFLIKVEGSNGRFAQNDSNHRFVTSVDVYRHMMANGWIGEGVVFCEPAPV